MRGSIATILPELYMLFFSIVFLFLSVGKRKADLFTWAKVLSLIGLVITLVSINGRGKLVLWLLQG